MTAQTLPARLAPFARRRAAPQWLPMPRNLRAVEAARRDGGQVLVSLIGEETGLAGPHVFVDPGRRYDWRPLAGLDAVIVTRPGLDTGYALAGLFSLWLDDDSGNPNRSFVGFVDAERKQAGYVLSIAPLRLWMWREGCEEWRRLFG